MISLDCCPHIEYRTREFSWWADVAASAPCTLSAGLHFLRLHVVIGLLIISTFAKWMWNTMKWGKSFRKCTYKVPDPTRPASIFKREWPKRQNWKSGWGVWWRVSIELGFRLEKFVNFSDLWVLRRERYVTFKYDIMVGVEVAFDPPSMLDGCWNRRQCMSLKVFLLLRRRIETSNAKVSISGDVQMRCRVPRKVRNS